MATEKEVLDALRNIIDPDLKRDIVSLGFIKDLQIDAGAVRFKIELTTAGCPVKDRFREQAQTLVEKLPGVQSVEVTMTAMKPRRPPTTRAQTLDKVGAILAISSCKGGVGKSTVAAYLARAIQREGHRVGLLDTDIYGPSFPTLFNMRQPEVYIRGELLQPVAVDALKTMSMGYLLGDRPAVMRGPMASNHILQMLQQTEWGELDYLIIDLPPGTGDIQLTLVQQAALDGAIIVTTPQALSLVDVARGILMFEKVQVPVLGVVENMAVFTCDGCGKQHHLFGQSSATLKDRFGLETLASLPILPGLCNASARDAGAEIPEFAMLADRVHRELGKRRAGGQQKPEVTAEDAHVIIKWPDGAVSRIPNKALRLACQCALCVQEFTGEPLLDPAGVPDDIRAEQVEPLGHYAVSIAWNDGHSSGIYSWEHLRRVASACQ